MLRARTTLLVASLLACGVPSTAEATQIDVITMGEGDHLFSHFGHAAICVTGSESRCYNYGTTDFSTPGPLTWDFVRGRALFWVSVTDLPRMLAAYRREDRTVWRQRLPLTEAQARGLAERLEASTAPGVRTYRYHHLDDNCSTRVRDAIEAALPGALSGAAQTGEGATFRELARRGFRDSLPLLVGAELLLGRRTDQVPTTWELMFLPEALRAQVQRRFGAAPQVLHQRAAPLPDGSTTRGRVALALAGLLLGALALGLRRSRWAALAAVPAGLAGALVWGMAIASPLRELRVNEVLLVLWPSDVLLPLLSARLRRGYAAVRVAGLGVVLAARIAGLLVQPLLAPVLLVFPVVLALRAAPRGATSPAAADRLARLR